MIKHTTNTNKKVRAFINETLNTLDMRLGNATYLDAFEVIQLGGGDERIKTRLEACGCVSISIATLSNELSFNSRLDTFLNNL